ncbi:ferric iron reductase FhuF-like transporter-domain-containing protein [Aspergillus floccosus]
MTIDTTREAACFETTRRLLTCLINEGLVDGFVQEAKGETDRRLYLRKNGSSCEDDSIVVHTTLGALIEDRNGEVLPTIQPGMLCPPVTVKCMAVEKKTADPGEIFSLISPWFKDLASQSSGLNQVTPVQPEDIPAMLTPGITFLSLPHSDLSVAGPFNHLLQPLLQTLEVPEASEGRTVVRCLTQQLPSIMQRFPRATILKSVADCADAQASLRTLTVRPELKFPFHLKLSLACQITSALRTITPWSAQGEPIVTEILDRFFESNPWTFKEIASVTGSQPNFDDAKHLSCILRDDLEQRARTNNEVLILAAALTQSPHGTSQPYAEILFNLRTLSEKQKWFREYVECLLDLILPPLVNHGIGLEAHGQNILARVCRETGKTKGFDVRDFGGIRLHTPTLRAQGVSFDGMFPGWAVMTKSMNDVWGKVHHSLLQNHIGFLLNALDLQRHRGWGIVRDVLEGALKGLPDNGLYEFCMKDTIPLKCFLRMRMEGKYRDYVEREVPNVLLMGSEKWEAVLASYVPSLHWT